MSSLKLLCAIPCYNESFNLPALMMDLKESGLAARADVLFIDDGSTDGTPEIIASHGYPIHRHAVNRGYGGAVQTAFEKARDGAYGAFLIFPGDHQRRAPDALKLVERLEETGFDVVVGSKFHIYSEKYGPIGRRLGNRIFSTFARLLWRSPIQDVLSGFKVYRVSAVTPFFGRLPESYALDIVFSFLASVHRLRMMEMDVRCRYDEHTTKMRSIILVSMKMMSTVCLYMLKEIFRSRGASQQTITRPQTR